jgi:hypothetical protein
MSFSPKDPLIMTLTFLLVITFGLIKDGFEDFQQQKSDREINENYTKVYDYSNLSYEKKSWAEVCVGDII